MFRNLWLGAVVGLALTGCRGDGPEDPELTVPEFGLSDPSYDVFATSDNALLTPRDVAFHSERDELWVLNRYGTGTWDAGNATVFFDPLGETDAENHTDSWGSHFMAEVSALAFGAAEYEGSSEINFATCQESRNDYNGTHTANDFMGPTLWSSDLSIYANVNQALFGSLQGSHLDMLHQSPLCMGIAHDTANVYWVTDGFNENIVRYDFAVDHGPGYDDHSDGIVRRFSEAEFTRVADVPGHLILDQDSGWLYYANTGEGTVMRLDTNSGESTDSLPPYGEPLAEYTEWTGATVEVFAEDLGAPSGVAVHDGRLFVTDYDTAEVIAYDVESGEELGRVQTDAVGITGIDISSAGEIFFADMDAEEVVRIIPGQ